MVVRIYGYMVFFLRENAFIKIRTGRSRPDLLDQTSKTGPLRPDPLDRTV